MEGLEGSREKENVWTQTEPPRHQINAPKEGLLLDRKVVIPENRLG